MKSLCFVIAAWLCLNYTCLGSSSGGFSSHLKTVVDDERVTKDWTSHIVGPNNYCIQVRDNDYHNGGPVILQSCTESEVTQIWTSRSDGTIRSNGKCLTSYADTQGAHIMIYDCPGTISPNTIWKVKNGGKLASPAGLVITAISGKVGTELTLEMDVSSSFQSWIDTDHTKPVVASIVGLNGLCLQTSGSEVWVATCDNRNAGQRWLLYADATIRPEENTNRCLSYDNLINARVVVMSCGLAPSSERWGSTGNDHNLVNQRNLLAIEVKDSKPELREIIVHPITSDPNQKWKFVFLGEKFGYTK